MYTLYHCQAARSLRCLWALEEAGAEYDLKILAFPPRYAEPEYLEENPLGTIPLFIDGAVRMTESMAICHYVAEKEGADALIVKPGEEDYGDYLDTLFYGEATLTAPLTVPMRYDRFARDEDKKPDVAEDYRSIFRNRLQAAEKRLSESEYMAAGRFTMADISVGYALILARFADPEFELPAPVAAYFGRLKEREAFQRARAAEKA